jgi:hypothetical protein
MGYEGVRVFWDANGTVIERSDGKKSPTVDFPFTEDLFNHVRRLAEIPPDKMTINDKLHRMHDFVDPNIWRRMNRNIIPTPLRWGFRPSLVDQKWCADNILWKMNQNIPFNPFVSAVDYDTYIAPYRLTGDGINALRRSSELEHKNTVNTGMPWTVRWDLAHALSMIRQYLDPKYGILLNPDLKRVSASHIKPTGWLLSEAGGFLPAVVENSVQKEFPVVVDDDDYLNRLAEHLGFIAFSTVSEKDAKEQREKCPFQNVLPGRKNGNGHIFYDIPLVEIPERIAKLQAV